MNQNRCGLAFLLGAACLVLAGCRTSALGRAMANPASWKLGRLFRTPARERPQGRAPAGSGFTTARRSNGEGTSLTAHIEFLAENTVNVSVFYPLNDRWTVGLVGQRLVQRREVDVQGQLIDTNDLSRFVPGFSVREQTTSLSFGPAVQFEVLAAQRDRPAIVVGAYALEWGTLTDARTEFTVPAVIAPSQTTASEGDAPDAFRSVYVSAHMSLPWFESVAFIEDWSVYGGAGYGARTGKRFTAAETGQGDPRVRLVRTSVTRHRVLAWGGTQIDIPLGFAAFAEGFTGDECNLGYNAGLRWTSPIGITFSLGITNCVESIGRRPLDVVFLPGGVGGQPSIVSGGGGLDSGGLGFRARDRNSRRRSGV